MTVRTIFFTTLLALSGVAIGATPPPPASTGAGPGAHHQGPCEKDPSKCQADAAKFDQWCQANADKCTNLKSWAEKRIERCEKNPQKCQEMHEKMHAQHEEMCQQDPSKPHCHAIKANNQPGPSDNDGPNDEPGDDQQPPPPM